MDRVMPDPATGHSTGEGPLGPTRAWRSWPSTRPSIGMNIIVLQAGDDDAALVFNQAVRRLPVAAWPQCSACADRDQARLGEDGGGEPGRATKRSPLSFESISKKICNQPACAGFINCGLPDVAGGTEPKVFGPPTWWRVRLIQVSAPCCRAFARSGAGAKQSTSK